MHTDNLIFGLGGQPAHAVCELVGFENGVEDIKLLCTSYVKAVEDQVENLRCVDKVASVGQILEVDAEVVDALEASSSPFQGLEVRPFKVRQVTARIRGYHDDVFGGHVQVQGEGAAALFHLLDQVLADLCEAEECRAVAVEAVARQDEEHDVQEELGERGEGVLTVHVGVSWGQTNVNSTCIFYLKKKTRGVKFKQN